MSWTRSHRLAAIVAERGLKTTGFRKGMRTLLSEFCEDEYLEDEFLECFGKCQVVPAAWSIERGKREGIFGVTVHVYEVEGTAEISDWKLEYYGNVADGEGPHIDLHILDKYDNEIVVPSEYLMRFMIFTHYKPEERRDLLKEIRSRATIQHHAPVTIAPDTRELDREIANLKRELAKRQYEGLATMFENVVYGLGIGQSRGNIARAAGTTPAVVRATERILAARNVSPKSAVKKTHERWKVAYDALKEMGIQI